MKIINSRFKLYRRENINLFLKNRFMRCFIKKKDIDNENSDFLPTLFNLQLKEKQKLKIIYGVSESQFKFYYYKSKKIFGNLSENLLRILESRLDNVVYRMGIGFTRLESRQIINHNCILVNKKKCNIPSFIVNIGDIVSLNSTCLNNYRIINCFKLFYKNFLYPPWIFIYFNNFSCYLKRYPNSNELDINVNEDLVLDFYSK